MRVKRKLRKSRVIFLRENEHLVLYVIDAKASIMHTGCFTIIETKRQLLKPLPMTLFFFCFQIVIAK